jgi:CDP-glucose 4,6-dehydratase
MNVLVTGAYGMLGGWLTRALLDRGDAVTVLKRDATPGTFLEAEDLERRCTVVHGDITDPDITARAIAEHEVDTVFHLAAQTIVGTAARAPLSTWEANIRGTYLLLEACRAQQVQRTVVAASDKAYGPTDTLPYTETHPLQPTFPYDVSKAATDLIARSYWHTYGLPVATTRFANIYGGGDRNASRLIPEAIDAALQGRAPIIRSDGSPERDFLYVADAAAAYLAIADALDSHPAAARGEAFNAGGDAPHAVRDVVALVCRLAGTDVEPDVRGAGTPDGEIDRQFVDSTKLRTLTGWRPETSLEDGLRATIAWYRAHPS